MSDQKNVLLRNFKVLWENGEVSKFTENADFRDQIFKATSSMSIRGVPVVMKSDKGNIYRVDRICSVEVVNEIE